MGIERPHTKWDDIHGAPLHAARELLMHGDEHFLMVCPVVSRAYLVLAAGADEGAIFYPSDVSWGGAGEKGVRAFLRIEPSEGAVITEELGELVPLGF